MPAWSSVHDVGRGPIVTRFRQFHDGVEVFGQNLSVMMGRDMKLVATSGYFAPSSAFEKTSKQCPSSTSAARRAFSLTAEQALAKARSPTFTGQTHLAVAVHGQGPERRLHLSTRSAPERRDPRLRHAAREEGLVLQRRQADRRLVSSKISGRSVDLADDYGYSYVMSAADGAVLFRKNLSEDVAFSYRVYADANGINQPFDGPIGNDTARTRRPARRTRTCRALPATPNLVTLESGPISTGDPWLAPDATTETLGNNVDAYLDLVDGGVRPPGTIRLIESTASRRTATTSAAR